MKWSLSLLNLLWVIDGWVGTYISCFLEKENVQIMEELFNSKYLIDVIAYDKITNDEDRLLPMILKWLAEHPRIDSLLFINHYVTGMNHIFQEYFRSTALNLHLSIYEYLLPMLLKKCYLVYTSNCLSFFMRNHLIRSHLPGMIDSFWWFLYATCYKHIVVKAEWLNSK